VREEKNRRWQDENKEAIEHYNKRIEKFGVFSDSIRSF
ncbi:MAG: type II toxin-antitoxin system CcdA family antitoxin, partial [Arcobacteraceae bacterium]|nr:type II toxin-antitoxin system CcdA family antitoxin [Arcobacteraceae bacterium]